MAEQLEIKQKGAFSYIDQGQGRVMLLLHGLFGALSNWGAVVEKFSRTHRIIIPLLPIYEMPLRQAGMEGLTRFVEQFVEEMGLNDMIVMGNSLGGHIGLMYTLNNPDKVGALVLTGSSGLFENVKEIFETLKSISRSMRIVAIAKSAQRHNMAAEIAAIKVPTLLIWGLNDTITPPAVAHEFNKRIPNSTLRFIDKCCHAPMMERPQEFNEISVAMRL